MGVVIYYGALEVLKRPKSLTHEKRICPTKASPKPVLRIEALFAEPGNIQRCSCIGNIGRITYLLDVVFRHCI